MFFTTSVVLRAGKLLRIQRLFSTVDPLVKPKVCVVGSGPGGFYAVQHILKNLPAVEVDILERLPVPFGLVRYGVAPDHPEVKNVINSFTKTALDPRVNFIGNVSLGRDVFLNELLSIYHSVLLAYGADDDRRLGIEGENLGNVLSAREFVGWYNGLPANKNLNVDLNSEKVAILGQGNVALDIARILLTPVDILKKTDITEYSLATLSESKVQEIILIGRRGPLEVAFTIKEFREMLRLPNCNTEMNIEDFAGLENIIPSLERPRRRLTELLLKTASDKHEKGTCIFRPMFYRTPKCFVPRNDDALVGGVRVALNTMEGNRAVETDVQETLECGLALRSIGFKSIPVEEAVPFDHKRGVVINDNGVVKPGLYVSGWLATGPVGVIISTMSNAFCVAQSIVSDIKNNVVNVNEKRSGYEELHKLLQSRGIQTVDFEGWERINKEEMRRGQMVGKPREKIVDISEMLAVACKT